MTSSSSAGPAPGSVARGLSLDDGTVIDALGGLDRLVEMLPSPTVVFGADGTVVAANEPLRELLGLTAPDPAGFRRDQLIEESDVPVIAAGREAGRTTSPMRVRLLHASGHPLWVEAVSRLTTAGEGVVADLCQFHDITARRDAESALAAAEEEFRTAFDAAPIGMALLSASGHVLKANRALAAMLGQRPTDLMGHELGSFRHPDEPLDTIRRLLVGAKNRSTTELRMVASDGRSVWVQASTSLVRHASGEPRHFIAQFRDVTAQRAAEAELHTTIQELERSNADLEQFAHVAAHDLKAPLGGIRGMLESLKVLTADRLGEDAAELVDRAVAGTSRMNHLIEDLLSYASLGAGPAHPEVVDLNDILRSVVETLEHEIETLDATVEIEPMPTVTGDATQLRQLFQNLVGNGLKFHRPDVPPVVRVWSEQIVPDGNRFRFHVRDNGIGIPAHERLRVFDVFSRLHGRESYPGTGVGLAICKRVVEHHGGEISVEETDGPGTLFVFTLAGEPS